MIINSANMDTLRVGYKTAYQGGFDAVPTLRDRVSEVIASSTGENIYAWLGELPGMREWLGARVVNNLRSHDYRVRNRDFEQTVGVDANHIADDLFGMYTKRFEMMGRSVARHPETLVWGALADGFTSKCYDGQNFFDTDHPVLDENGEEISVANTDGGSGTPWFLLCTNEVVKPIILQVRQEAQFTSLDRPADENVFMNRQFIYGTSWRGAVAYGFWQFAWGSKQDLTATNYATAREALMGMKGDYGHPMGLKPDLLVVPPSLEGGALEILNAERNAAGATNVYKGTAELLVSPWLA